MSETGNDSESKKSRISYIAILSLVLSILGFCTNGLTSILSLLLGTIALIRIRKSARATRGKNFAIAGIVISTVILFFVCWNSLPATKAKKTLLKAQNTLANGRLANLPESTTDLKASGWGLLFTGEDYIRFAAMPEDIDKFIAESASIREVTPEILDPNHMYLPHTDEAEQKMRMDFENYIKHEYYNESSNPPWYKPTIKKRGRIYKIPGDPEKGGHNWGSVIVNDETNTVYIWVIWS